jgi:hypothetical protein
MIGYSRIAEKVWKFITTSNGGNELKKDEMSYLDWQVIQWAKSIPDSLKLPQTQPEQGLINGTHPSRSIQRLQSLLYLRANLMRMFIYRPILHTAVQMAQNPVESTTAVEIAKDTIRFITQLNTTSNIYQLQQVAFNWFLVSALAVLFLAVAHAPGQFNSQCKDEFYMALELVKGFSMESYISQRLWKSIRDLRKLAPKIGLQKTDYNHGAISTPAIASATADMQEPVAEQSLRVGFLPDGTLLSRELMDWFEAIGEAEHPTESRDLPNADGWPLGENYTFGYSSELSSILRNCF